MAIQATLEVLRVTIAGRAAGFCLDEQAVAGLAHHPAYPAVSVAVVEDVIKLRAP
jgi:hypothetical protein